MKTYTSLQQLRLVGKGWEIKRYLHAALQQASHIRLSDYLQGQPDTTVPAAMQRPIAAVSAQTASSEGRYRPQRKRLCKMAGRRIVPFPWK